MAELETETIFIALESLLEALEFIEEKIKFSSANAIRRKKNIELSQHHQLPRLGDFPLRPKTHDASTSNASCHQDELTLPAFPESQEEIVESFKDIVLELREIVLACVRKAEHGNIIHLDSNLDEWVLASSVIVTALKEVIIPGYADEIAEAGTPKGEPATDDDDGWSVISDAKTDDDIEMVDGPSDVISQSSELSEKDEEESKLVELLDKLKKRTVHMQEFLPILRAYVILYSACTLPCWIIFWRCVLDF